MKKRKFFLGSIISLVILDQLIKVLIKRSYMGNEQELISNFIYFKPHLNIHYSWINSLLDLGIGFLSHIIAVVTVLIILIFTFDYIKSKNSDHKDVRLIFIFFFAGAICSLIDKLFWGGSLDYVYLKNLFIFDLKDCYVTFGGILSVVLGFKYESEMREFKIGSLIKHSLARLRK